MKKLLLLACAVVVSLGALSAQNSLGGNHYNVQQRSFGKSDNGNTSGMFVNLGVGYGLGYDDHYDIEGLALDADAGYLFAINRKLAVGAGIGINLLDFGDFIVLKLYSQAKFTLPINDRFSFISSLNLGLGSVDGDYFTFLAEPSIGIGNDHWTYSLKFSPSICYECEVYACTLNLTYKF